MKKLIFLLLIFSLLISGCACITGVGRDVENVGKWMQDNAG